MSWYAESQKKVDISKLPKSCKGGDCYCAAGRYLMDNDPVGANGLLLVHGEVTGQGKLQGVRFGHAWVERGDMCIDVSRGRSIEMPKAVYYAIGRIEEDKVFKYDADAAREKMLKFEHWGPWDLKTKY